MTYPFTTPGPEHVPPPRRAVGERQPITFKRVLRFVLLLPFRVVKFILLLPFRVLRWLIRVPGRIIRAFKKAAWYLYQVRLRITRGIDLLKEGRRWIGIIAPRDRVKRTLYYHLHPARLLHRLRSLVTRLRGARAWPEQVTGLPTVQRGIRWARQNRRHRSRFATIEALRQALYANTTEIDDLPHRPPVGVLAWLTSMPPRWGALLHGLIYQGDKQRVLALGTGFGIGGLYMARALLDNFPMRTCLMVTVEREYDRQRIADDHFRRLGYTDFVVSMNGEITEKLPDALRRLTPVDLAFIDLPLDARTTLEAFRRIRSQAQPGTLIVISGIHLTPEMAATWRTMRQMRHVAAAVDLWRWGIVVIGAESSLTIHAAL